MAVFDAVFDFAQAVADHGNALVDTIAERTLATDLRHALEFDREPCKPRNVGGSILQDRDERQNKRASRDFWATEPYCSERDDG